MVSPGMRCLHLAPPLPTSSFMLYLDDGDGRFLDSYRGRFFLRPSRNTRAALWESAGGLGEHRMAKDALDS
jgi:hypothetical protein